MLNCIHALDVMLDLEIIYILKSNVQFFSLQFSV